MKRPVVHPRIPRLLGAAGVLMIGISLSGEGTYALWSDTATIDSVSISAGALDLQVDGQDGNPTAISWTGLQLADIAPGESTADVVTVSNAGTIPFTVSIAASATGALRPAVQVRIVAGGAASTDTTYPRTETCSGGTQVFSGVIPATQTSVVPATAAVAASGTAVYCVEMTLSTSADTSLQLESIVPTFVFIADQA